MQLLSVAVALGTLGFTFTLSRSRRGIERYGIVLVVLPLALATPLAALMASGLQLINAFRQAGSGEGLEALATAVLRAAETQYVGHITLLALLGPLALVLMTLGLSRPDRNRDEKDATEASSEPKPFSRFAIPMMVGAVVVCIAAVAILTEYEDRFIASPLAMFIAFDADDVSEYSSNKRTVDEHRRVGSNTLVLETFRTLVVIVLFLALFDTFLVGSRSATFNRRTLLLSASLIAVASAVSVRAFYRHQELRQTIEDRLKTAAEAKIEERETTEDAEPTEDAKDPVLN